MKSFEMFCWKIIIVKINCYGTFATYTRPCCSTLLALTNLIPRNYFMKTIVPGSVLQWRIWSTGRVKHVAKATPSFLEAEKAPAPVFLKSPMDRGSLAGCGPWGRRESDLTDSVSTHPILTAVLGLNSCCLALKSSDTCLLHCIYCLPPRKSLKHKFSHSK